MLRVDTIGEHVGYPIAEMRAAHRGKRCGGEGTGARRADRSHFPVNQSEGGCCEGGGGDEDRLVALRGASSLSASSTDGTIRPVSMRSPISA